MFLKFAPTELLTAKHGWLKVEDLTEPIIAPSHKEMLLYQGVLTMALKNAYGQSVKVERLRQREWTDAEGSPGLRRDVFLKIGATPYVAASTFMPAKVIAAYPWLATLGNTPLGEALEERTRYQRSPFEFRQLAVNTVFPTAPENNELTWARRSWFIFASSELLVMEAFFPDVLDRLQFVVNTYSTQEKAC